MSSNSTEKKKGGGFQHEQEPRFRVISPIAGQQYITAAQRYCLRKLSEVVSTMCNGILPFEMLEYPPSYDKRNMLGRKAGKYHDSEGNVINEDQSLMQWRAQLILETRDENGDCTEEEALNLLFPSTGKKAREAKRQLFASQSQNLMHNLNMLWPSDSMVMEMAANKAIKEASNIVDLIAWDNAFTSFCLENCGNADMNARAAEETLESLRMKGLDLSSYVKAFRTAAENCKRCRSTYTVKRIVETFIRNLNQNPEAFFRFAVKMLDTSDKIHLLTAQSLDSAISFVENYYRSVIVPDLANKKVRDGAGGQVKTFGELKNLLTANNSGDSGSLNVPLPILAAMLKRHNDNNNKSNKNNDNNNKSNKNNNNNNNNNNNINNKSKKRKFESGNEDQKELETDATTAANTASNAGESKPSKIKKESTATSSDQKPKAKRICYSFSQKGSCQYGDRCFFDHSTVA